MFRSFVFLGATNALLAVALGAFGAHALRERLEERLLAVYQTGVQYHLAHALGLLLIATLADKLTATALLGWSGRLMAVGIVLFSGSLYALALTGITVFGAVTPLGGLCFLASWALLAVAAVRSPKHTKNAADR